MTTKSIFESIRARDRFNMNETGLYLYMSQLVSPPRGTISKQPSTVVALEWFLPGVKEQMSLQVFVEHERLATLVTHPRFLCAVGGLVTRKSPLLDEHFTTLVALVRLLADMDEYVSLQMGVLTGMWIIYKYSIKRFPGWKLSQEVTQNPDKIQ